ncbi:hypothetical protein OSTOST_18902, partial [Ostertagia ostertagi]
MMSLLHVIETEQGLNYIHHSFLGCHGRLTSASCLVTDSFQVKVCDCGLSELVRVADQHKIWMAPELMNSPQQGPSKSADIYSFAIVASEVIRKTPAWSIYGENEDIEDIIAAIKRGGSNPLRPSLLTETVSTPAEL